MRVTFSTDVPLDLPSERIKLAGFGPTMLDIAIRLGELTVRDHLPVHSAHEWLTSIASEAQDAAERIRDIYPDSFIDTRDPEEVQP